MAFTEGFLTSDAFRLLKNFYNYGRGATNIYTVAVNENCDNSSPLNMKFFVPDETIRINAIKLTFQTFAYRTYSRDSTSTPARSTYGLGPDRTASGATPFTSNIYLTPPALIAGGSWNRTVFIGNYVNKTNATRTVQLFFFASGTSETLISNSPDTAIGAESQATLIRNEVTTDYTTTGSTIAFRVSGTDRVANGDIIGFKIVSEESHIHDLNYGIFEDTLPAGSVSVRVGPDGGTLILVGSPTISSGGGLTNLDITSQVGSPWNRWFNVQFTPGPSPGRVRIEADAYIQLFIKSV